MNLQQLEYIIALDTFRHFEKAAQHCFVTQATLSMMIKKLEAEMDLVLFDRSKQPVVPTEPGKLILEQARLVVKEVQQLKFLSKDIQRSTGGHLRIGIIPTLAPYLLPLFLNPFLSRYPHVKLKIVEQTTANLVRMLSADEVDVAIMATPLAEKGYAETFLFNEELQLYTSAAHQGQKKKYILPEDIDVEKLWLLEEGHCLRSQVLNLCALQKQQAAMHHLDYETGSIESLLRITQLNKGMTIIPHLATLTFTDFEKAKLRHFKPPVPVREISLVTYRHFVKRGLLQVLEQEIKTAVNPHLPQPNETDVVAPL